MSKQNFYQLDKLKPYTVLGGDLRQKPIRIFLLLFPLPFLVTPVVLFCIYFEQALKNPTAIAASSILFVTGLVFLIVFGRTALISKKGAKRERSILADCELTEGQITQSAYKTLGSRGGGVGEERTFYRIKLEYDFTDRDSIKRKAVWEFDQRIKPEYFSGQHIMVAFSNSDSLILSKFSLHAESQTIFEKAEEKRSKQKKFFDGLNGCLLKIDLTQPIKSAEMHRAFLIMAASFFIISAVIATPFLVFAFSNVDFDSRADIIFATLISVFAFLCSAPFLSVSIVCFVIGLKKLLLFKRILKGSPYFTYANVYISNETSTNKSIMYCYIDHKKNRYRKKAASSYLRATLASDTIKTMYVMYDDSGNSILLHSCVKKNRGTHKPKSKPSA